MYNDSYPKTTEEWQKLADRRTSPPADRLLAGMFLLYQRATGAKQNDRFLRDEKSWGAFEQAALPEMQSFTFFDRPKKMMRTPNSVLADAMGNVWIAEKLPKITGQPTTIQLIQELVRQIASKYEITPIDRRMRKRASLGLDVLG